MDFVGSDDPTYSMDIVLVPGPLRALGNHATWMSVSPCFTDHAFTLKQFQLDIALSPLVSISLLPLATPLRESRFAAHESPPIHMLRCSDLETNATVLLLKP